MSSPLPPNPARPPGQPPAQAGDRRLTIDQALALAQQHQRNGRLPAAEEILRKVVAASPQRPEALGALALLLHQTGRLAEAIDYLSRTAALQPMRANHHANLCEMLRQAGRLDEALEAGRRAVKLKADYAEAHNNLGIVHFDRGEFEQAAECYRKAVAHKKDFAQAWSNLGNAERERPGGSEDEALACYERAIKLRPDYADAWNNKGSLLRSRGQMEEAALAYKRAIELRPNYMEAINNIGVTLQDLGEYAPALAHLKKAVELAPRRAKNWLSLGSLHCDRKRPADALAALGKALELEPTNPEIHNLRARALFDAGKPDEALASLDRAVEIDPNLADAYNNRGNMLKELGRIEEAEAAYHDALARSPRTIGVYVNLVDTVKVPADSPATQQLEALRADLSKVPETDHHLLHFSLAKIYDDAKRYEEAMGEYLLGNAAKRRRIRYDEEKSLGVFDRIMKICTREMLDARRVPSAAVDSRLPIFVLGMPRSGTTLVEQVIASHPLVSPAGELHELSRITGNVRAPQGIVPYPEFMQALEPAHIAALGKQYVERLQRYAPEAQHITDKMPSNFYYLGLINLALPNAKVIHTVRNPLDTCVSCFSKLFTGDLSYTYDLSELGRFYRKYHELMAHWRAVLPAGSFLDVVYEEVVDDLEGQARRILDFIGLPWDPACLDFHKLERPVKTASVMQVRQPIYRGSVERWRRYGEGLRPLIDSLGDLART